MMINNMPVDWIYRDIDRVRRSADLAVRGEFDSTSRSVIHSGCLTSPTYAGEVPLGVALADPTGELGRVKHQLEPYPQILGQAVVERLDEARFLLDALAKPVDRSDTTYVAGCLCVRMRSTRRLGIG